MRSRLGMVSALLVTLAVGACGAENDATDQTSEASRRKRCGNGQIDKGEDCDGQNMNNQTCATVANGRRPNGTLGCSRCEFDMRLCTAGTGGTGGTGGVSGS
jgi:hypothetical protein